jgi:hypothetical protein
MIYIVIILTLFLSACDNAVKENESSGSYILIPFFSECVELINLIKSESIVPENNYLFNIHVELFDKTVISHRSVLGTVRLSLNDKWYSSDAVGGLNSREYLMIHATGIQADCSPDNYMKIMYEDIDNLPSRIETMKDVYKNRFYINHESDGVGIYFNDGSYSYPLAK